MGSLAKRLLGASIYRAPAQLPPAAKPPAQGSVAPVVSQGRANTSSSTSATLLRGFTVSSRHCLPVEIGQSQVVKMKYFKSPKSITRPPNIKINAKKRKWTGGSWRPSVIGDRLSTVLQLNAEHSSARLINWQTQLIREGPMRLGTSATMFRSRF